MGLKSDWEHARRSWGGFSWLVKLLFVFFAISPIASLAETVVQWKGFIRDGLDFYRSFFTEPISRAFAEQFGSEWLNKGIWDLAFLSFLSVCASIRVTYLRWMPSGRRKAIPIVVRYALTLLVIYAAVFSLVFEFIGPYWGTTSSIVIIVYSIPIVISGFRDFGKSSKERVTYFGTIVGACAIVGIFAAINKGLE